MVEDDCEVGAFDGNGLVSKWDVLVLVSKAEVGFNANERDDSERKYPRDDYESIVPSPVSD